MYSSAVSFATDFVVNLLIVSSVPVVLIALLWTAADRSVRRGLHTSRTDWLSAVSHALLALGGGVMVVHWWMTPTGVMGTGSDLTMWVGLVAVWVLLTATGLLMLSKDAWGSALDSVAS